MRLSGDHCSPGTTPSKPTGTGCCLCQHFHSFYNCSPTARPSASYSWRLSLIVYGMGNDVREVTESMPGRPSQVLGTERRQLPPFPCPELLPSPSWPLATSQRHRDTACMSPHVPAVCKPCQPRGWVRSTESGTEGATAHASLQSLRGPSAASSLRPFSAHNRGGRQIVAFLQEAELRQGALARDLSPGPSPGLQRGLLTTPAMNVGPPAPR